MPWGIEDGYCDIRGQWHDTSPETRRQSAGRDGRPLGDVEDPPPRSRPVWFVRQGTDPAIDRPAELVLEDGTRLEAVGRLPPTSPSATTTSCPDDGGRDHAVVVTPGPVPPPVPALRTWGWAVQLYATRSSASWGIGDLADLAPLARWSAGLGAGFVAVNPLHAAAAVSRTGSRAPTSRAAAGSATRSTSRIEDVPGATDAPSGSSRSRPRRRRRANDERLIDRDAVFDLKMRRARARCGARFRGLGPRSSVPCRAARACASTPPSARWPSTIAARGRRGRRAPPSGRGRRRAVRDGARRSRRVPRSGCSGCSTRSWRAAGEEIAADAATSPSASTPTAPTPGCGRTCSPAACASARRPTSSTPTARTGACRRSSRGGSRAAGYEPFVQTVRAGAAARRRAAHRPRDGPVPPVLDPAGRHGRPTAPTCAIPADELLDIVALESVRAGAFVVGEDLGTVEDERARAPSGARDPLVPAAVVRARAARALPRRRSPPSPPTTCRPSPGSGRVRSRRPGPRRARSEPRMRRRAPHPPGRHGRAGPNATVDETVVGAYQRLGKAPSLVAAALDDALGVEERPNLPGTVDERPNWCLALPSPLEEIEADPRVLGVAAALGTPGPGRWPNGRPPVAQSPAPTPQERPFPVRYDQQGMTRRSSPADPRGLQKVEYYVNGTGWIRTCVADRGGRRRPRPLDAGTALVEMSFVIILLSLCCSESSRSATSCRSSRT